MVSIEDGRRRKRPNDVVETTSNGGVFRALWMEQGQFHQFFLTGESINPILVGGLEHFVFFHVLGIIIPIDKLIFFRRVGIPPTSKYLVKTYPITVRDIPSKTITT